MNRSVFKCILLASAVSAMPVSAYAQPMDAEPPADAPSPNDPSLQSVSDAEANASGAEAQMALLQAQLQALQAQVDEMKKAQAKNAPVWKGAPQFADADSGFSWKVRGRFMADAGYVGEVANDARRTYGFNTRVRRVRLGVEGTLPGDFGYKAEMDFANSAVGFGDVVLSWNPHKGPVTFTLGNQESLDGMEQISSSRWSSFIERAQINDAFGNTRRLGFVVGWKSKDNLLRADIGAFASHSIDASLDNQGWIGAGRITYAPFFLNGFLHLGVNAQYRDFASNNTSGTTNNLGAAVGSPSTGQIARYRARPFLQLTDQRYVDTGEFAAKSDLILGGEMYGVFKSLHLGGEAQYVKVRSYRPGDILTGLDAFSTNSTATTANLTTGAVTTTTTNTNTMYVGSGNPSFWGGHFEVGYFLTGETRGYKNGAWDRTKVLNPIDKGGIGAIQIIGRVDYLDLSSGKLQLGCSETFSAAGACTPTVTSSKGGSQTGYLAGLTWIPTDYVRFLVNYIHTEVEGGPKAGTVGKLNYSTDAVAVRAQFDF